ncbi:endonuclease [Weeksella virosa]|uniref:endonuclease n=1 Tax=Weeksella virosa TaxID=1014 RepID=UPI002556B743|nr:endonuclease [Weeksella virosa]MDK7375852.1 endonuclease [Weeksella virosa]
MKFKISILASAFAFLLYGQSAPTYYNSVDFNKTKNELKNNLASLITNTHTKVISYSELKDLLKISDVDPHNSSNLLLIYGSKSHGEHQRSRAIGGSWNREHVYAKSKGTPNLGTTGPGADGHHLRPADPKLNSTRGNLSFDDGQGSMAYKTPRGGWFPGDEWKGDVARILMYMYVRYDKRALPLNITFAPATYSDDFPDILLKWNVEDPVSDFEIQRNNIVAQTQGNRNPFIDNPYLATVIWGGPDAQNTWPDTLNGGNTSTDTESPTAPTNLKVTDTQENSISLTWDASVDNVAVNHYEVYVDGNYRLTVYSTEAKITGLEAGRTYSFYVIAKDAAGNKSENSQTIQAKTNEINGGGNNNETSCGFEDFSNVVSTGSTPPASSYSNRTWSNNGIVWTATNARTDSQIYIDGVDNKAICMRKGSLTSSKISGGIGSLSVKTYLPFNDSEGTYTLLINGEEKGQIPYSKNPKTHTISDINVEGDIVIKLVDNKTNNRVSFDNLSWTCYSKLGTNNEVSATSSIVIYPNPVLQNEIFVDGLSAETSLQIFDVNGRIVQTIDKVKNRTKIRLNNLPKGVYIVKVTNEYKKIIVK